MSGLRDDQNMGHQPSDQDPSLRVHFSLGPGPSGMPPTRESRSPFSKAWNSRDSTVTAPLGAAPVAEAPCVSLPGSPVPAWHVGVGHRARAPAGPTDSASLRAVYQPASNTAQLGLSFPFYQSPRFVFSPIRDFHTRSFHLRVQNWGHRPSAFSPFPYGSRSLTSFVQLHRVLFLRPTDACPSVLWITSSATQCVRMRLRGPP